MSRAAKKPPTKPSSAMNIHASQTRVGKPPARSASKDSAVRVVRDAALPPRHLTKSTINAAVRYLVKATAKASS